MFVFRALKSASASASFGRRFSRAFHSSVRCADHYPNADFGTFKKVTSGPESKGRLVLVDFYADWCKPCHMLSPILERISNDTSVKSGSGRPVDVVTIDTQSESGFALGQRYHVRALPTVIAFSEGKDVMQFVGALPETGVREFLGKV